SFPTRRSSDLVVQGIQPHPCSNKRQGKERAEQLFRQTQFHKPVHRDASSLKSRRRLLTAARQLALLTSAGMSRRRATLPSPRIVEPLKPRLPLSRLPSGLITAWISPTKRSTTMPARWSPHCTTTRHSRAFCLRGISKRSARRR